MGFRKLVFAVKIIMGAFSVGVALFGGSAEAVLPPQQFPTPSILKNLSDCSLTPDSGNCLAYFTRFFYDKPNDKCQTFVYGGCGGNANNFVTFDDCQRFRQACLDARTKMLSASSGSMSHHLVRSLQFLCCILITQLQSIFEE